MRGPDALNEYAVDPVGVDRINPSAYYESDLEGSGTIASVRCTPSMKISIIVKCGERPLCRITSFMAWVMGSEESMKSFVCRVPFVVLLFVVQELEVRRD